MGARGSLFLRELPSLELLVLLRRARVQLQRMYQARSYLLIEEPVHQPMPRNLRLALEVGCDYFESAVRVSHVKGVVSREIDLGFRCGRCVNVCLSED